ncbi:MAG: hypothetical protein R3251_02375 [Candidatus Spechtbacterales bacterium]|nr:hypothetical protein [Candidatus Spechtbacterales bacterium]
MEIEQLFATIQVLANPVAVLMIAAGAFFLLIGGGSEKHRKKGKGLIVYAVVGYILLTVALPVAFNMIGGIAGV